MKVDVLESLDAVGGAAWAQLHAASALRSPFLTFTWQRTWTRAFAGSMRVEIRTVRDGEGRLVAVLPLYEAEPRLWRLIGGTGVSDYLDLLAVAGGEEDAWLALLRSRTDGSVWDLHALPATSPTVPLLPRLAPACGLVATASVEERCPVLALPGSWDAYLTTLSPRHRHEMLRKVRRLHREAPDARVSSVDRPGDVRARFDDFLHLHRRSRAGKARFMDERMEGFFREAIAALAGDGGARIWFLDTAAGPIATFICLEWDGSVGLYNSGFHPDRASLAPGLVLLTAVVQDAITRGKARFDFLRGEERYKYEFGPAPEDVYAVRVERATADAGERTGAAAR
ncbi:MAG: GNAT family N-acetyltransferase [Candidatus Rokubacteria bacterium]|nr:GNAT family N-acetyltransferase [Candidatus Rokubacteria bacterium]